MSPTNDDPRCPTCDGPVSATAPYCLHCGADLGDETPDSNRGATNGPTSDATAPKPSADRLLDPDGLLDDS